MRIAVTGASGMLGTDVVSELTGRGHEVAAVYHHRPERFGQGPGRPSEYELDVTDLRAVRGLIGILRPHAVVNCAAYTRVDDAEADRETALAVNALGPRNLALACREVGAALLHVSTDYVFDGDREVAYTIWDTPSPLNVYGISKLWGENYVRSLMSEYYIVRTSWLFGLHGRNFVQTMLELGRKYGTHLTGGECLGQRAVESKSSIVPLRVVSDQRGSPTYTVDLAKACADLLETRCFGIYHVTNQGVTTWYEFAKAIFEKTGLVVDVLSVTSDEFSRPAKRPKNSALDPFPLRETIGYLLPSWEDALGRYLRQLGLGVEVDPGV
ncbi:MAG TPA: NAD(P)-dependent oxidoreductase [Firmicutes bacterium]|nr:NAD(P)-dependent oxidoreductase [Bacillota bacterium]